MSASARFVRPVLAVSIAAVFMATAHAEDRSGKAVVEQTCSACHAEGKDGAPKIGDLAAWSLRAQGGFAKLSAHAIAGKNKMPAHGGHSALSDLEVSRAIAFMATGGRAADPDKPYTDAKTVNGDALVSTHCIKCHGDGLDGAPKLRDFADWKPRLGKGVDGLVRSAIAGHNKMPARAGMPGLNDADIRGAVNYMIVQSAAGLQH